MKRSFASAATAVGSTIKSNYPDLEDQVMPYAQILGAPLYLNEGLTDKQRGEFLADIVVTVLENVPELAFEFNLALQLKQETE